MYADEEEEEKKEKEKEEEEKEEEDACQSVYDMISPEIHVCMVLYICHHFHTKPLPARQIYLQ